MNRHLLTALLLTLGSGAGFALKAEASPAARHAIKPAPRVVIKGTILLGDPSRFTTVGTVDRRVVFARIPAYQRIRQEHLSARDPRYHFLLRQANLVFQRALQKAAGDNGVDLVVEAGGVSTEGIESVDLTEAVVREIEAAASRTD